MARWTAGNAPGVPHIAWHAGEREHIARLESSGVDMARIYARSREMGFIRGFYMSPERLKGDVYGEHAIAVAVRMRNPLRLDHSNYQKFVDQMVHALPNGEARRYRADASFMGDVQSQMHRYLTQHGYDGVIRQLYNDSDPVGYEIIAVKQGTVRVIKG